MKIAQVCPRFYPYHGGVETHVYEISKRLSKWFDVEILTTDPSGALKKEEKLDCITIRRFKSYAPSNAYYFSPELFKFLKRNSKKYDIVHIHNYHSLTSFFGALAKTKNKLIFTPHYHRKAHSVFRNLLIFPYSILLGRKIFERADEIVCVSEYEKKLLLNSFKISKDIFVIPNGVNFEEFKKIKSIKKDEKTILYVGRIEKYKGVQYLVEVLSVLQDWKLIIVGRGQYKPKVIELAKKLGVLNRITFLQDLPRNKLLELYARASVFVLLSKQEAYGITVAEALVSKTPCIVAKSSALIEWVDNKNVFGINYPIDIKKLAELIVRASQVKVKLTKKLNKKIISWDDVAKKLKEIYLN